MTTLTRLSMYPDPRPHMSNEERLQILRRVWPVQCGNNYFKFNGGGGVESRHAKDEQRPCRHSNQPDTSVTATAQATTKLMHSADSRSSALPASTLYGANARVDGRACESEMGFLASHQTPEIDTGRSTSARTRGFVGSSTIETYVHASLGALSEATIYGVNAQADALRLQQVGRESCGDSSVAQLVEQGPQSRGRRFESASNCAGISTGHPTLSRSQSASCTSLPVGGLAPTAYEPDPPTQEEITEAFYWKYGLADETD